MREMAWRNVRHSEHQESLHGFDIFVIVGVCSLQKSFFPFTICFYSCYQSERIAAQMSNFSREF